MKTCLGFLVSVRHVTASIVLSFVIIAAASSALAVGAPEDNLAFNQPIMASSTAGTSLPSRAVDYRYSTSWQAGAPGGDQWLRVDLGEAREITGAELRFNNGSVARAYTLDISDDDASWTTVVTAPADPTQIRYHPFHVRARYVRWYLNTLSTGTAQVSEFWVFGPPRTPLLPIPDVSTPTPPYINTSFVRGADVSHLLQNEYYGAVYHDVGGAATDALQILKDHGINTVRIKVWNDPGNRAFAPARMHDPLGFNNAYWATRLAVRARQMGFRIMIDFHYSDTWADPGKQFVPHEWLGLSVPEMAAALYDFTSLTLQTMVAHGVTPEWVQIGNEIPGGLLWPYGQWWNTDAGGSWENLVLFLKAGHDAVKDVDPSIKVVIHYDNSGQTAGTQSFYDNLAARGVDWDVTGLSYYPQWHGGFAEMNATLFNLAARYHKPVNIVETAHPWTTQNFDQTGNSLGLLPGFPYAASVEGQIGFLDELVLRIKSVPDGLGEGLIYWEPEWTPVVGAGWAIGEGSGWENATLFDQNGSVLPSIDFLGNRAPVVYPGWPASIQEGDTFDSSGQFVDQGVNTWTATVDYDDGTGPQSLALASDHSFHFHHTYFESGVHRVKITVTDDEQRSGVGTTPVSVANLPPWLYTPWAWPQSSRAGEPVEFTTLFRDPGIDDAPFTGTINYGDGTEEVAAEVNGNVCIGSPHTYALPGVYTVTVSVTDKTGGTGSRSVEHTVMP